MDVLALVPPVIEVGAACAVRHKAKRSIKVDLKAIWTRTRIGELITD